MKRYLARSPKGNIPAQPYEAHVAGVREKTRRYALDTAKYAKTDGDLLLNTVNIAATYHDLGKLDPENQAVLQKVRARSALPVNHVDAGTAHLLTEECLSLLAAVVVSSHHCGLSDFIHEKNREDAAFRDDNILQRTNDELPKLLQIHDKIIKSKLDSNGAMPEGDLPAFLRVALSCLVDADHTDSAINDGDYPSSESFPSLRAQERLSQLDAYVATLRSDDERGLLRDEMYRSCRDSDHKDNIVSCSSPVGSGKTTAVMAHMLSQAEKRGLRRIFVVLPFTNIIKQSVEIYRKALVLPGENPNEVVAELHHRAEFESEDSRHLTALWRAPVIVTTAVAFFETLASKGASGLRRLHELPGSAVFVDEAHAALPAELLPISWRWMKIYAREWSCYWVLASGSLNRFWDIDDISPEKTNVPEIVDETFRRTLNEYEKSRVSYKHELTPKKMDDFLEWIVTCPGPRLVILNTVQSAAVIADYFSQKYGREHAEHLSTALTAEDRDRTLNRVQNRLDSPDDNDWTLFATSCVEAGVDLSFRTGFRELASLTSLLQTAGRIDRSGFFGDSTVWSFCLAEDERLKSNPGVKNSASVLRGLLREGIEINPLLTTSAIRKELKLYGTNSLSVKLTEKEKANSFPFVDEYFQVIKSNTKLAIVDDNAVYDIANGHFSWRDIQAKSVQIAAYKLKELHIPQIVSDIYQWTLGYDDFIGYMRGIISARSFNNGVLII